MRTQVAVALYVVLMAASVVVVDVLFFRNRFWERLVVNIGIVFVFAAFLLEISEAFMTLRVAKSQAPQAH